MYRSSQNQNYFIAFFVILFHIFILLAAFFWDARKRLAMDFGLMTAPIFVSLHQGVKIKTQTKHTSNKDGIHTLESSADQKINSADGVVLQSAGLTSISKDELRPLKIDGPKPHYPISSRRLREEGQVMVRLCIDSSGKVEKAQVQKSSGYPNLDHSALSALSKWRFSAKSQSLISSPEECFRFPVRFSLEG